MLRAEATRISGNNYGTWTLWSMSSGYLGHVRPCFVISRSAGWSTKFWCAASLQITFLLTIALSVTTSLQSFPFTPRPTFQFLHKLDLAFSSLLKGISAETGEPLPGFDGGRGKLSTTEKVRMRGIVERTRVVIVEATDKEGSIADVKNVPLLETDTEDDFDMTDDDDMENLEDESSQRRWEMEIARVYERTIVELGLALDVSGPSTDGWGP